MKIRHPMILRHPVGAIPVIETHTEKETETQTNKERKNEPSCPDEQTKK